MTEVLAMSGIVDRYRRFVVDGSPVATGFVAVADAWGCTNPSAGRGLTVGMLHALRLRDVLRDTNGDAPRVAAEFDRRTEAEIAPWYHAQIAVDRARFAEMEALREGRQPPPPGDDLSRSILSLLGVMGAIPISSARPSSTSPRSLPCSRSSRGPRSRKGIRATRAAMKDAPSRSLPGPDRRQLLDLLS
jgi:hypothetical protein